MRVNISGCYTEEATMRVNISGPLQGTRLCGSKISFYIITKKVRCYRFSNQPTTQGTEDFKSSPRNKIIKSQDITLPEH